MDLKGGILVVLREYALNVVGSKSAVNVLVNRKNGCKTASTDATGSGERELLVSGTLVAADAEKFLELVVDVSGALNVASGTKTYSDVIFTLGRE